MLDEITLENRLIIIEQALKELKDQFESNTTSNNWLFKLIDSISDEEAFSQALKEGRAFRQADQELDLVFESE